MNNYNQYKSPEWQKRKSLIMALHDFRCQNCMKKGKDQLHVHHINYEHGRDLWDYDDRELLCLCSKCHTAIHKAVDAARFMLGECARGEWGIHALGHAHDLMCSLYYGNGKISALRACHKVAEEMDNIHSNGVMEGSQR